MVHVIGSTTSDVRQCMFDVKVETEKKHWMKNDAALINFMMTFYELTQLKTLDWRRRFMCEKAKKSIKKSTIFRAPLSQKPGF